MKSLGTMGPLCRQTIEELLNVEGRTIKEIAAFFETDYFDVYKFIQTEQIPVLFPKSGRRIPAEKMAEAKRLFLESNMPILEIANRLGLSSRSSIYCLRDRIQRETQREAVAEEEVDGRSFKDVSEVRRCPEHGKVTTWPCVACEALAYRKRHESAWVQILSNAG